MKKLLLTLIVSLAFCGSIFAQYETHYDPEFDMHNFADQKGFVAGIIIDGVPVTIEEFENWSALEVVAFVGEEQRSYPMYLTDEYHEEYGDPYPIIDGAPIYYTNAGEIVSFRMFDHMNNIEYKDFVLAWYETDDYDLEFPGYSEDFVTNNAFNCVTGEWIDQGWYYPSNPAFLCFTSPQEEYYIKDITGYGNANSKTGYYLISSPIGEVDPDSVLNMTGEDHEFDLYWFNQEQELEWVNYHMEGGEEINHFNLMPGKGYLYASAEDVQLKFKVKDYTSDGVVILDKKANAPQMSGWNLVGNPLADTAYIEDGRDFYVMLPENEELLMTNGKIEPMQGLFVEAAEDGETITFTPAEQGKRGGMVTLNLSQGRGVIDRAGIRFGQARQLSKLQLRENSTKLYIPQDNAEFAVVRAEEMGEMPVNFKAQRNGNYTISFTKEEVNFSYLHLIDNLTGADVDLLDNPSYNFEACTADYQSRFKLVFSTTNTANSDEFGFVSNGHLLILGLEGQADLKVMDVTGRTISTETFSGSYDKALNLSNGVYLLQLVQGNNVKTQKIVVK